MSEEEAHEIRKSVASRPELVGRGQGLSHQAVYAEDPTARLALPTLKTSERSPWQAGIRMCPSPSIAMTSRFKIMKLV